MCNSNADVYLQLTYTQNFQENDLPNESVYIYMKMYMFQTVAFVGNISKRSL